MFPQVHLSALLDHKVKGQDWRIAFRHINGKSVDYVLCDKATLQPVYAIELDDYTHEPRTRYKSYFDALLWGMLIAERWRSTDEVRVVCVS